VRVPDEPGDPGGVAHGAPRLVVQVHAHQDVARQHLAVDLLALAVLDLGDLFGGNLHLEDVVADIEVLHTGLEVGLHLVLVAGVGMDDIPVARLAAQVLLEGDRGIQFLFFDVGRLRGVSSRLVGGGIHLDCRGLDFCGLDFCGLGDHVDGLTRGHIALEAGHGCQSSLECGGCYPKISSTSLARPRSTRPMNATMNARKASTTVV